MKQHILIIGGGGHAHVLVDTLQTDPKIVILGILEKNPDDYGKKIGGVDVLGNDALIKHYSKQEVQLVNGLGSVELPKARIMVFNKFKALGYQFFSVIHPTAYIAKSAILAEGVQIMAGCIIQANSFIGDNVIVNTNVAIDHDCHIGQHVHIAPGSTLCGNVLVGESSHIGCGAVIKQGISLGSHSLVGAGAVVIHDVVANHKVVGIPAKRMKVSRETKTSEELA